MDQTEGHTSISCAESRESAPLHVALFAAGVCLRVEAPFPLGLSGVHKVHNVPRSDEQDGDDDKDPKVLRLRRRDDHEEVQQVHQVVHGALDSVNHTTFRLADVLLEQLGHR